MTDKTYIVRTFGCQMNEHDSERIAGLLEADGLRRAASVDEADVVVLNTCCIRENADNKLYGNLGHLKTWKHAKPGRQIVVSFTVTVILTIGAIVLLTIALLMTRPRRSRPPVAHLEMSSDWTGPH